MIKSIKREVKEDISLSFVIVTVIFTFIPSSFFENTDWIPKNFYDLFTLNSFISLKDLNTIISRISCFLFSLFMISIFNRLRRSYKKTVKIEGSNYAIIIEYGDIFEQKNCKRVINFDECFTTKVGDKPSEINKTSICGQYLLLNPNLDIQHLISESDIKEANSKSKYKNQVRYDSGTIVPNGDDLLMAFAKLDENGKGRFFTHDEYLECLNRLWKQLELYYCEKDVCLPILGAGTTAFEGGQGASITKQELLDIMIMSYKLTSHKIKKPHVLHIICSKSDDFSINNIQAI